MSKEYYTISYDTVTGEFLVEDSNCNKILKKVINFKLNYQFDDHLIFDLEDSFDED